MSEFVGRTGSLRVYSYPETRRAGSAPLPLARNYATSTKGEAIGPSGLQINWNSIDVGPDPSTDIQITPLSTGELLISGVVTFTNDGGASIGASITVRLGVGDIPVPVSVTTIPANSTVAVPFLVETEIISPLNELHLIKVFVQGDGLAIFSTGTVVNVQEVPVSTG